MIDNILNDWKWRFRNRFLPIHAAHGNPPEDITEPIIDFFDDLFSQYKQQLVEEIQERCKQTARFDEQDAIDIITNQPTPPIPNNGWRERLQETIKKARFKYGIADSMDDQMLEEFFQQELHTAIEEERKRFVKKLIQLNNAIYDNEKAGSDLHPNYFTNDLIKEYSPSDKETTQLEWQDLEN